eukprot:Unigene8419_Nuclearia_a/m.25768 Unigene8419_Nuclearia_a/g.25768  ORF Unigene8419_Nuclearia_a/g.25768 Unigene8419_Nuclearia_a/m.25768 type:complete len:505 (-) Unigene8419_Nuclearia_a:135-1649(-)
MWAVGVALYTAFRRFQPLRARDYHLSMIAACMPVPIFIVFTARAELGDTPATCWTAWVAANLLGPIWVVPFEIGAMGLVYVYEWNLEKLTRSKGFWRRNASLFFSPWFRRIVIGGFIFAQFAVSTIVQRNEFVEADRLCIVGSPYAIIPFYCIYAVVFLFIVWKLYTVEDVFHMKFQFTIIFALAVSLVGTWLVTTSVQRNGRLRDDLFTVLFINIAIAATTLELLYHPLILLACEPWRTMMRIYQQSRSATESDTGLRSLSSGGQPNSHNGSGIDVEAGSEDQLPLDVLAVTSQATLDDFDVEDAGPHSTHSTHRRSPPLKLYLTDPIYAESFKAQCVKCFCVESVMFYLDARDAILQAPSRPEVELEEIVSKLVDLYIRPGADLEVNLSHELRAQILRESATRRADPRVLRGALSEVYYMLKTNVFATWLDSYDFKRVRLIKGTPAGLSHAATGFVPGSPAANKRRSQMSPTALRHPLGLDPPTSGPTSPVTVDMPLHEPST